MKAIILAAGIGKRLGETVHAGSYKPPKALLRFGGKTLLQRHLEILKNCGIAEVVIVVGYEADRLRLEIDSCGGAGFVRTVLNPDFREGSVVSLASAQGELLNNRQDILLMDADVLYDSRMIRRLLESPHRNCFLMDRDLEPGEEPVKLCLKGGAIVDFHKKVKNPYDECGESVGFFRFSPAIARRLADRTREYLESGRREEWYEETIRDILLDSPAGTFGFEDVTGLPWIEIDFPEDVLRAEGEILPQLVAN